MTIEIVSDTQAIIEVVSQQPTVIEIVSSPAPIIEIKDIGQQGPSGLKGDPGINGLNGEIGFMYQLTSLEIASKQIMLLSTPDDPSKVKVDIQGGCIQVNGVDFNVASDILSWDSLGMETVITEGDYLQITY